MRHDEAVAMARELIKRREEERRMRGRPPCLKGLDWSRRSQLERVVAGALKSCINDHGPIRRDNLGSASKRVLAQLKGFVNNRRNHGGS